MTICDCKCHQIESSTVEKNSNCGSCGNTGIKDPLRKAGDVFTTPITDKPMFVKGSTDITGAKTLSLV